MRERFIVVLAVAVGACAAPQPQQPAAPPKPDQAAPTAEQAQVTPPVAQTPMSATHGVPAAPPSPSAPPKPEMRAAPGSGCLGCHEGIERIGENPAHSDLSCQDCHRGNLEGTTAAEAHRGMWASPSHFNVVNETCGGCHDAIVTASKRSLHATMAGMIGGSRCA
jgi:hypothetical protein